MARTGRMRCIVGLGNPGLRYERSRHNVGFQAIDRLSHVSGIRIRHAKALPLIWGRGRWVNESLVLAKPLSYMNRSGLVVKALLQEIDCGVEDLIVLHDDLDLAVGRLKFKERGGDGGHKGIRSIIASLGHDAFLRLRIGIGRPPLGVEATDYVLSPFEEDEREIMELALDRALGALRTLLEEGLDRAMNLYHAPS